MRLLLLLLLSLMLSSCMPRLAYETQSPENKQEPFLIVDDPNDEIISVFKGAMSDGVLFATLIADAGTEAGSSFYSFAVGKTIAEFNFPKSNKVFDSMLVYDRRMASLEWEANIVKHFGKQKDFELNFIILGRWHLSPFDHFANVNVAFGEGLSYASEIPYYERIRWPKKSQLLNNMTFEFAVELPFIELEDISELTAVVRLHHRSGVFGLFNGVHGASNVVAFGLRARYF